MSDLSVQIPQAICKVCGKDKIYKSTKSYLKFKDKPCRSCSNYLFAGGLGLRVTAEGLVCCSKCKEYKSKELFHIHKGSKKPYSRCRDCHKALSSVYFKETYKYSKYGITKDQHNELMIEQDSKCAGCNCHMDDPHTDHDHSTGKVRGLLCHPCNVALGLLKDNLKTLENLILYVEKSK